MSRVGERGERLVSPELQGERILAYAASRGLPVDMCPPELDVSGGKVDRPILKAAIERIERGEAAGIIVAQLDRLSRAGIVTTLKLIQRIETAGGKVIAVAESFDDSTPEGRMGRNVMLALAEMQLDRYRSGFAQAKAQAVKRGIWPVPKAPRGYRIGPKRGLVPSGERSVVIRGFEAAGASWSQVAEILSSSSTGAMKAIRNRAYLGEIVLGALRNPSAHQPLVERALWEAAQVSHPAPLRRSRGPNLLTGLIRCAACGYVMTLDDKREWRGYRCHARKATGICPAPAIISARLLDPFVEAMVLHHLSTLAFSQDVPDALSEAHTALDAAEVEQAYQRVQSVSGLGGEHFLAGMRSRVEAVDKARGELAEARSVSELPRSGVGADVWPGLSVAERNHLLRGALSRVTVRKGRGDVLGRVQVLDHDGAPVALPEHLRERFR